MNANDAANIAIFSGVPSQLVGFEKNRGRADALTGVKPYSHLNKYRWLSRERRRNLSAVYFSSFQEERGN